MPEGEKIGGASSKGWVESAPLVGIELTDLPKIGTPSYGFQAIHFEKSLELSTKKLASRLIQNIS